MPGLAWVEPQPPRNMIEIHDSYGGNLEAPRASYVAVPPWNETRNTSLQLTSPSFAN